MTCSILFVVPEFPPYADGGGGVAFHALTQALSARGHTVSVFTGNPKGFHYSDRLSDIYVKGFPLVCFPHQPKYLEGYLPTWDLRFFSSLISAAKNHDMVHIHGMGLPFCDFAALWLRAHGIGYMLTNHGYPHRPGRTGGLVQSAFQQYEKYVVQRVVSGASKCSAVSTYCAQDGPLCCREVKIILNGISSEILNLDELTDIYEKRNLLFVGRLQEDKGILLLIEAMQSAPDWSLSVIGPDAGALSVCAELVEKYRLGGRIFFEGRLDRARVQEAMRDAYAVVMPSYNEPFGLVGLEAMANGTLLITSDEGGGRSYADADNALLFKCGNLESLCGSIKSLPLDPGVDKRLRHKGRITAQSMIWDNIAAQYEAWYAAVD